MFSHLFAVQMLRANADGLAGLATSKLFETNPEGLGEDFDLWREHMRTQVKHLAVAIQTESNAGFAEHVEWLRGILTPKLVSQEAIACALQSLEEVTLASLPTETWSVLEPQFAAANAVLATPIAEEESFLDKQSSLGQLAHQYIEALRAGNEGEAKRIVLGAQAESVGSAHEIMEQLLAPALREMGRLWHRGKATIAEEHLVTNVTQKLLVRLIANAPVPADRGQTALFTSVGGDEHSIGIQMVSAYFELDGWRTICLGANTPPESVASVVQQFGVGAVLLSATLETQIEALSTTTQLLKELDPSPVVLIGGSALNKKGNYWQQLGADGMCKSGLEAVDKANALVKPQGN